MEDFLLTRGMFYSQKTYGGLEEFENNLGETIIGEGLIPQDIWGNFPKQHARVQERAKRFIEELDNRVSEARRYVEEITPDVEKLVANNLASLSPEELLRTRQAWVKYHQQIIRNHYRVMAFKPMEKRFNQFNEELERLIESYYPNF
jgi:hypothetical protein